MEFGPDHKVDIETLSSVEAPIYLEFLDHEQSRHMHEWANAMAMVT